VPRDGDSLHSLVAPPETAPVAVGDEWLAPPIPRTYDDPDEGAFRAPVASAIRSRASQSPCSSTGRSRPTVPAHLHSRDGRRSGRPSAKVFEAAAEHARSSPDWECREIATNHVVPSKPPAELSELLLGCL
jgi:hypothetical protein